ncbi:MAG: carbamoyltransferase HypF [Rectinemataceae bacterium]|jgi:hydrogenase maturation protein HypF
MELRRRLLVRGLVQGLGFRPSIARAAASFRLTGRVFNTLNGAQIEIQGGNEEITGFLADFASFIPAKAVVESLESSDMPLENEEDAFRIIESAREGISRFSVPPDIALCPACRKEFLDPHDRRYLYPFISCGECGPRYSFMRALPYDRENTAMAGYPFCPDCLAEYENPKNRRFHIEGFCCPVCGPRLTGLEEGIAAILAGGIVAIKGIGGYHLACLADDPIAIRKLRERKNRPAKPLAAMYPSLEALEAAADLLPEEGCELLSPEAPIVLVPRERFKIPPALALAPDNPSLGVFLPYSPLHELILMRIGRPLAMTSANLPGDPLVIDDEAARNGFSGLVEAFIAHDRPILQRADDGVVFFWKGRRLRIRNGRGSAPRPIQLASASSRGILALGAELKSTVSVVSGTDLATSPHIGDLESLPAFEHFRKTVDAMLEYYGVEPEVVVVDLHPDYESTRLGKEIARKMGIALLEVQHHYAHFLSVLLDTGKLDSGAAFLGIILDGTGYGSDGTLWGGELILGDPWSFERLGSLSLLPLPGGEAAIREPWRIAAGIGLGREGDWRRGERELDSVRKIAADRVLSPLTSSCGRLFDAAAAILGFERRVSFEGEAAIWLENLATEAKEAAALPRFDPLDGRRLLLLLAGLAENPRRLERSRLSALARGFHVALAESLVDAAAIQAERRGRREIVLAGGVFQNRLFLEIMMDGLAKRGMLPLIGDRVPLNDGGISVGQAAFALKARRGTIIP